MGEAAHPGPRDPALVFLGACNPTGLNGKHELVAALPQPALWAISESHLTASGADKFRQGLKLSGSQYSFLGGFPAPIRQRSKVVGAHTGVGFVSSFPIRAASQQWPDAVWRTSRSGVASYGYPVHPQSTVALLEEATQRVVLEGDGPRLLAGDLGTQTVSHLLELACSRGLRGLQLAKNLLSNLVNDGRSVTSRTRRRATFLQVHGPRILSVLVTTRPMRSRRAGLQLLKDCLRLVGSGNNEDIANL